MSRLADFIRARSDELHQLAECTTANLPSLPHRMVLLAKGDVHVRPVSPSGLVDGLASS